MCPPYLPPTSVSHHSWEHVRVVIPKPLLQAPFSHVVREVPLLRLSQHIKVSLFICSQSMLSFFHDLVRLRNASLWSAVSVLTCDASRHSHEQMQTHRLRPPFFQPASGERTVHGLWFKQDLKYSPSREFSRKMRHLKTGSKGRFNTWESCSQAYSDLCAQRTEHCRDFAIQQKSPPFL